MNQYNWNAADYAKHSTAQLAWAQELIAKLNLRGHASVLDIGCGEGKITAEIACQLPQGRVMGVDSSPEMIDLAQKSFQTPKHPNLSFRCVDARELPFREEFEIVFSNAALHWVKNHRPVIAGIARSLKPGGRILLQMGGRGNADGIISVLEDMIADAQWRSFFADFEFPYGFHDPQDYSGWLREAGMAPRRVELIPKDMTYPDREGLAGWIRTTWLPYTNRIPSDLKPAFIDQLVERYLASCPPDDQGTVHVSMIRLEAEAVKD